MRIYMQSPDAGAQAPRFVQLILQQDLLGGWLLMRESGQQGGRSTLRREFFEQREAALSALEQHRDQQIKRGFRVTFSQGDSGPGSQQRAG
jgi:predicted DNA-binding WGR domain protein